MKGLGWLILIAVIALALGGRPAQAAPRPEPEPERRPPDRPREGEGGTVAPPTTLDPEVQRGWAEAQRQFEEDKAKVPAMLERWGDLFGRHPKPNPPHLNAMIVWRESAGDPSAASRVGEKGLFQLTPAEVTDGGGGNPLDPEDAARIAQAVTAKGIRALDAVCRDPQDQILVGLLWRSIGAGSLRDLLATAPGPDTARARIAGALAALRGQPPGRGRRQTLYKYSLRVARCILRAGYAADQGWIPASGSVLP
jgi:hypothetical protein